MSLSSIVVLLQAALSFLLAVQTNPAATVESKQQALMFAGQSIQIAQEALESIPASSEAVAPLSLSTPSPVQSEDSQIEPVKEVSLPVVVSDLSITTSQGIIFPKGYSLQAMGESFTIKALVVSAESKADRELLYPAQGVPLLNGTKGVVYRFQVRECQSVKPEFSCPGKEIATAEEYQSIPALGYVSESEYKLNKDTVYRLEVPETANLVYLKAVGEQTGTIIEKSF